LWHSLPAFCQLGVPASWTRSKRFGWNEWQK
jgi:hypothetical protein